MPANTRQDLFQYWLANMDDALDEFISSAPVGVREKLDLSANSLNVLEQLVLDRYQSPTETKPPSEAKFVDSAARYFGEVLRRNTGSKWMIRFENEKDVHYGKPILWGGKIKTVADCPLTAIIAATDRRIGDYLLKVVNNLGGPEVV